MLPVAVGLLLQLVIVKSQCDDCCHCLPAATIHSNASQFHDHTPPSNSMLQMRRNLQIPQIIAAKNSLSQPAFIRHAIPPHINQLDSIYRQSLWKPNAKVFTPATQETKLTVGTETLNNTEKS